MASPGPTRVRDLVLLGAAVAVLAWVFTAYNFRDFPVIAWVHQRRIARPRRNRAAAAVIVKRRVAENEVGRAHEQLHPVTVARFVALAGASAIPVPSPSARGGRSVCICSLSTM